MEIVQHCKNIQQLQLDIPAAQNIDANTVKKIILARNVGRMKVSKVINLRSLTSLSETDECCCRCTLLCWAIFSSDDFPSVSKSFLRRNKF
jgi:hypothetical protein